jgi:hypothetical protein
MLYFFVTSCSSINLEQRVKWQLDSVKTLDQKEVDRATAQGKAYFEQQWPTSVEGKKLVQGKFLSCEPTDSNNNGKVSCFGYSVDPNTASFTKMTIYCGYMEGKVNGCSEKDQVN